MLVSYLKPPRILLAQHKFVVILNLFSWSEQKPPILQQMFLSEYVKNHLTVILKDDTILAWKHQVKIWGTSGVPYVLLLGF